MSGKSKGEMHRKKKGMKPGEIFNEKKQRNERLLMLRTIFNPPVLSERVRKRVEVE